MILIGFAIYEWCAWPDAKNWDNRQIFLVLGVRHVHTSHFWRNIAICYQENNIQHMFLSRMHGVYLRRLTRAHYSAPVYVVSNQSVFWLQNARLTKWVVSGLRPFSSSETKRDSTPSSVIIIIIIMYIYHALINALSAHMIHINLNMIFYTHVKHSPTKTIYIKYYLKIKN